MFGNVNTSEEFGSKRVSEIMRNPMKISELFDVRTFSEVLEDKKFRGKFIIPNIIGSVLMIIIEIPLIILLIFIWKNQ